MKLNKKIIIALYLVLFIGVATTSIFLIRASVLDKQNYMYDLQLSHAIMIINSTKASGYSVESSQSQIEEALSSILGKLDHLESLGVGIYYRQDDRVTIFKKAHQRHWPQSLSLPQQFWDNSVATSFHKDDLITSLVPIDQKRALVVVSKDDPMFDMTISYLNKTLPYLVLLVFIIGAFGWFFAKKITRPIENLNLSTQELAKGEWMVHVPSTTTTEINELVSSFNRLGGQLYSREQELLAKERLSALGTFSAGMAHELKNPLNIISSYSQLLERKIDPESKQKKHAEIISSEVKRATKIINDLMNFSRQKPLCLKSVNSQDFLQKLKTNFHSIPKNSTIQLTVNASHESINIDEDLFFQVIINLVENASHVLEEQNNSSPQISVSIANGNNNNVCLEVKDNGQGIPKEILPNIFEPFYTTKTVGKGTGLGLAFCKGIVEQHLGTIEVKSQPGETIFYINIPI